MIAARFPARLSVSMPDKTLISNASKGEATPAEKEKISTANEIKSTLDICQTFLCVKEIK